MPRFVFAAGVIALSGAASIYGCGESAGTQPPVLNGSGGTGLGSSGGRGSSSGSGGSSGGGSGSSSGSGSDGGSDGGSSSGSDGGGDGGSGSSSGGDAGNCVSGSGCNTLQVCGAQVNATAADAGSFPVPAGGTIVPGTYVLTAIDDYGSGAMTWQRETIQLTSMADGGSQTFQYDDVKETAADAGSAQTFEGAFVGAGTGFSITYTCPTGMQVYAAGYTATSTTLTVMAMPLVFTYTKQ